MPEEIIIPQTHRGLMFEDGRFTKPLEPGRYVIETEDDWWRRIRKRPAQRIMKVDIRQRELTIKGQEILTADKVAIRVNILVHFQVTDPKAAVLNVELYTDRIYSDVQLAARRSLAGMTLEEILTNRNRLSEEILQDVQESATTYGVEIRRADVKDLIFPGNLQEVMNRVLTAERLSQAELVDARTKSQKARIEAETDAAIQEQNARAAAAGSRIRAEADAEAKRIATQAEVDAATQRQAIAEAYERHPSLLRLEELTALRNLAANPAARIYIGFDKHAQPKADE